MEQQLSVPGDLAINVQLNVNTARLVIEALGNYPFNSVAATIESLRQQMDNQCIAYLREQARMMPKQPESPATGDTQADNEPAQ